MTIEKEINNLYIYFVKRKMKIYKDKTYNYHPLSGIKCGRVQYCGYEILEKYNCSELE